MSELENVLSLLAIVGIIGGLNVWRFSLRKMPADETLWHKWDKFFPVRLVSGEWYFAGGQLWRRRAPDGAWQYTQDPETEDEFNARIW